MAPYLGGMIRSLPRLLLVRLLGVLLLATVGLQAGSPFAAPLERSHGSAFSATTHEVALTEQRRAQAQRIAPAPLVPVPARLPLVRAQALPDQPAPRPASTAPPAREDIAWRPAPRAPPAA
jgi:hypothetical protein